MAIETELKLRIAPADLERLKHHPFLRSLSSGRAITRKLHSIYFDTPDLKLHHAAMALRLRRVGQQWLQTIKGGGGVQAGLHQRNEWETPVAGAKLDFAALEAIGASPLPADLRNKVGALFITDFARSIRMVQFEGALIELSLDSGEIRAGKSTHTISELELELKSGEPVQLFRLALALFDIVPLEIEATSKAEYGYRLRVPVKASVIKAQTLKLDSHISVEKALQNMIWSCLQHLQANVSGAVQKTDDEYLHQVRVALRRLRVVLGIATKHRADDELDALRDLVGELGTGLGRAREWDVFVTQTLPAVRQNLDEPAGVKLIAHQSEKLRKYYHQVVLDSLQTRDFQRLLLRFGAWMSGDYWRESGEDLLLFSTKILRKRSRKVLLHSGGAQQNADAIELHELRIACKHLRYSAEMFSSLYAADKTRRYVATLTKLQDILGVLNDNAVALRLLEELEPDVQHENVVQIRGGLEQNNLRRQTELRKAWQAFSRQPVFWHDSSK